MGFFTDRVHRLPRQWSNRELSKFAHLFSGDIVNVSAWKDIDKEGRFYKDYFINANSYTITNYKSQYRGFQGYPNEIFLDLQERLPNDLHCKFDVVFNHTTLEHIYNAKYAFNNLCNLSKDIVIIVVPFLQQFHSHFGDYWRFSPLAIKRMFEDCGFKVLYMSFNSNKRSSVYVFSIASKHPNQWGCYFHWSYSHIDPRGKGPEPYIGYHSLPNYAHKTKNIFLKIMSFFGLDIGAQI